MTKDSTYPHENPSLKEPTVHLRRPQEENPLESALWCIPIYGQDTI